MAVAGCINAYDCAGCYLTTLQQLQSDNIGVAINYTAPGEYGRRQLDYIKYTDKCGCTCCLTGENELRIVATQGVIKNFTLTNDDTNEVVNVKWNDLFGSNRAYTMVRYKTGSYPTSITDGTLAVKETTQNQYATNGYNVSGLTDGTTYYFTAFAVSQDGTIIVVQNKTVVPEFEWKPDENTRIYYKFNGNAVDYSSYQQNGTYPNGTPTFDMSAGQDGAYHGGYPIRFGNIGSFDGSSGKFTVSLMLKATANQGLFWLTNYGNGDKNNFDCSMDGGQISASVYTGSSSAWSRRGSNLTDGNWHHIVITKNGGTYTGYQDGAKMSTWSNTSTIIAYNSSQIGCHPNSSSVGTSMRMDNFIIQLNVRDDAYVLQYFNKIKNKFNIA